MYDISSNTIKFTDCDAIQFDRSKKISTEIGEARGDRCTPTVTVLLYATFASAPVSIKRYSIQRIRLVDSSPISPNLESRKLPQEFLLGERIIVLNQYLFIILETRAKKKKEDEKNEKRENNLASAHWEKEGFLIDIDGGLDARRYYSIGEPTEIEEKWHATHARERACLLTVIVSNADVQRRICDESSSPITLLAFSGSHVRLSGLVYAIS